MKEFPVVPLIRIWRPAVFAYILFPKAFYWQPPASVFFKKLFGCTIKRDAGKEISFIFSQRMFLYRLDTLNYFSFLPKMP